MACAGLHAPVSVRGGRGLTCARRRRGKTPPATGANDVMESDLQRPQRRSVAPDVRDWRRQTLRHAGFDDTLARDLAADGGVDLHDLLELVDRGCPPEVAARILAPL